MADDGWDKVRIIVGASGGGEWSESVEEAKADILMYLRYRFPEGPGAAARGHQEFCRWSMECVKAEKDGRAHPKPSGEAERYLRVDQDRGVHEGDIKDEGGIPARWDSLGGMDFSAVTGQRPGLGWKPRGPRIRRGVRQSM
jgi:hypothetical protein